MVEYDFEGYAKAQIDKASSYMEGFSKGYNQAKSEWVGLIDEDMKDPKTSNFDFIYGARWAEQILKGRNT